MGLLPHAFAHVRADRRGWGLQATHTQMKMVLSLHFLPGRLVRGHMRLQCLYQHDTYRDLQSVSAASTHC